MGLETRACSRPRTARLVKHRLHNSNFVASLQTETKPLIDLQSSSHAKTLLGFRRFYLVHALSMHHERRTWLFYLARPIAGGIRGPARGSSIV